ncbi:hypothetical protein HYT23_04135 [Candidatus Pacearchaeota archaeon]|nr:hypothetical protein [Candidatus Pacearchaeota archaeon]
MKKGNASFGGFIGGLAGFLVGIFIPVGGELNGSFFTRVTQRLIEADTTGFIVSLIYVVIGICLGYSIGAVIAHFKS